MSSRISLADHFTYKRLGRFVLPSIIMMVFTSVYGIVDGLFVSNFVGKTAFAAVNLIMPYIMMISSLGFMIGTGGAALVSQALGEKKDHDANRYLTMLVIVLFVGAVILSAVSAVLMRRIGHLLGGSGELLDLATVYGRISMISLPFFMLQNAFQSFMVAAEKPRLGLGITVAAGVCNMVMDFVLIGVLGWGIEGAAVATVMSEYVGGLTPALYFLRRNDSRLRFVRTRIEWPKVRRACTNGVSELLSNIAGSLTSMVYNLQLMNYLGENGVTAYGVIMYVNFIFNAIFFGYTIGSSPLFSYHYAAGSYDELHNLYTKSLKLFAVTGVTLTALSWIFSPELSGIFVAYDEKLLGITVHAMRVIAWSFIMFGFAVFGSAFFTALGDGAVSAAISFARTFVFQIASVMILPHIFGVDGIWSASVVSSVLSALFALWFMARKKEVYHY
jgi:putative MATE family efflux protein